MMKLATGTPDAGIQELLAYRRGEEYLPGGLLESNTAEEAPHQAKMAFDPKMGLAAGSYDLKARKKKSNTYQSARDYATTGLKGGLTGLGVMGALNTMRGRFGAPQNISEVRKAVRNAKTFAGIGATAAVADRAYRHDEFASKTADIGALAVNAKAGPLRSPGAQLSQARATALFRNVNHETEGLKPKSLQYGKFQVK